MQPEPAVEAELATIAQVAATTTDLEQYEIFVAGNTDKAGSAQYNMQLSEKRAGNVMSALTASGVPAETIVGEAFGETEPVGLSRGPHDVLERRVDIVVKPIDVAVEVSVTQ